jgi:MoxR-like ATPase
MLMLGDPGTGKTMLVTHLFEAIENCKTFLIASTRNKPAEKYLGPLDLVEYRTNGNYIHKRQGYITDVELALVDEIGKMSDVVGHDLLELYANRRYDEVRIDSGGAVKSRHSTPLHATFNPSNEIPTHESDSAAALYDRLLIRIVVEDVKNPQNFLKMLTSDIAPPTTRINFEDIKKAKEVELPQIELSKAAGIGLVQLRKKFEEADIRLSGRRWRWSMAVLRAAAFLAGDTEIGEDHLLVLQHTLWDELEQIETVRSLCAAASNPFADDVNKQLHMIQEVQKGLRDRAGDLQALRAYGVDATTKLAAVRNNLDALLDQAQGRKIPNFAKVADAHRDTLIEAFMKCQEQDRDVAELAASKRLGKGGGSNVSVVMS